MKTTIKKTIEEEVELQLPYFFKTAAHTVALFREDLAVQITDFMGLELKTCTSAQSILNQFSGIEKFEISSEAFDIAIKEAKKHFEYL